MRFSVNVYFWIIINTHCYNSTTLKKKVKQTLTFQKSNTIEQTKLINEQQRQSYFLVSIYLFLVFFAGRFVIKDALPYFGFDKEIFDRY